jgi:hypothetical protein
VAAAAVAAAAFSAAATASAASLESRWGGWGALFPAFLFSPSGAEYTGTGCERLIGRVFISAVANKACHLFFFWHFFLRALYRIRKQVIVAQMNKYKSWKNFKTKAKKS